MYINKKKLKSSIQKVMSFKTSDGTEIERRILKRRISDTASLRGASKY